MKKIYSMIMIVVLILSCPIMAYADTGVYKTAEDLFAAHSIVAPNVPDSNIEKVTHDNLPDSVCGYWVNDGDNKHYVVAIQDTKEGNEIKQKILDLIEDDSTISFVYQKYSYNYLKQIQDELLPYFKRGIGMISTGVREGYNNNYVQVGILTEKKNDSKTQKAMDELEQKYQDAIHIVYSSGFNENVDFYSASDGSINLSNFMPYFFLLCVATILLAFSFLIKLKERHMLVLQTTDKKIVTMSSQLTTKEIEDMIQKSNVPVPQDLEKKIMNTINKKI